MGVLQLGLALLGVAALIGVRELVRRRVLRARGHLLAIIAGTAVSYLGAVAIAFMSGTCIGAPGSARYVIDKVADGGDAAAKLQPGDVVVAADGEPLVVGAHPRLADRVDAKAPAPIVLGIERGGARLDVSVLPRAEGSRWLLGIMLRVDYERDRHPARRWSAR